MFDGLDETRGPVVPIDGWLSADYGLSGLPLMATEFSFRSSEPDPPNSWPPLHLPYDTQVERAIAYDEHSHKCFDAPYIAG